MDPMKSFGYYFFRLYDNFYLQTWRKLIQFDEHIVFNKMALINNWIPCRNLAYTTMGESKSFFNSAGWVHSFLKMFISFEKEKELLGNSF